jgi:hypothetical protein
VGEFCGIDPEGAKVILSSLQADQATVPNLVPAVRQGLDSGSVHVPSEVVAEARDAHRKLDAYRAFLDFWAKDLDWRIKYIVNDPDRKDGEHGGVSADDFPVDHRVSEAAGKDQGDRLRKLIESYLGQMDPYGSPVSEKEARDALLAEIAKLREHSGDPAFAAALVASLGGAKVRELFENYTMDIGVKPDGDGRHATHPEVIERIKRELGPLAEAFYAADHAGLLPHDIRKEVLALSPYTLSIFLRLGPQDMNFVNQAAKVILDSPDVPSRIGAIHNLVLSLKDTNPLILLQLLDDEEYANKIFDPQQFAYSPGYGPNLAAALDKAFASANPGSPVHQFAMANIIKLYQNEAFRTDLAKNPELAKTLAEGFKPYLAYAAYLQAQDLGANYEKPPTIPTPGAPQLPGISADQIAVFFGGIVQEEGARNVLLAEAMRLMKDGQLADFLAHPENIKPGTSESAEFQRRMLSDLGIVSLVLQGVKVADLDYEEKKKVMADTMKTLVVGYATMPFGGWGPVVDVGSGGATGPASEELAAFILRNQGFEDINPEDFRDELRKKYAAAVRESLELQNGKLPPDKQLSAENIDGIVRNAEAHFNSSVLVEIEEIAQTIKKGN